MGDPNPPVFKKMVHEIRKSTMKFLPQEGGGQGRSDKWPFNFLKSKEMFLSRFGKARLCISKKCLNDVGRLEEAFVK